MTKRFASVWDAIEATPEAAENMKLRSMLMMAIQRHVKDAKLSQAEAAALFSVTQPRISNLMSGRIDLFALDTLVNMAAAAGIRLEVRLRADAKTRRTRTTPARQRALASRMA